MITQHVFTVSTIKTDRSNTKMLVINTPLKGYTYHLYYIPELNRYDWTIGRPLDVARFKTEWSAIVDAIKVTLENSERN